MSSKQGNNESVLKLISFVVFLTLVNIVFFYLYRNRELPVRCTAESIVNSAMRYMQAGGNQTLGEAIPPECPQPGQEAKDAFVQAVQSLNRECNEVYRRKSVMRSNHVPLLTMFTTFAAHKHNDSEKQMVHKNTILNWAKLKPSVKLILFSNDTEVKNIAKDAGWDLVVSINESFDTPPVLKDMFHTAMKYFKTRWYGYSNGDILFMEDFLETIQGINATFDASQSVLITGRRTNVENFTKDIDVTDFTSLRKFAQENGVLYKTDAEDFFISSRSFPWNQTAPVVVGRPAYDNWLVGHARCNLRSIVIDVTDTVLAVHQTTRYGGNIEGYKSRNPNYNFDLFKKLNIKANFMAGLTPCCNYRTYMSFCDIAVAVERPQIEKVCECKGAKKV